MKTGHLMRAIVIGALAVALSGCTAGQTPPDAVQLATPSPSPTESATPPVAPAPVVPAADRVPATCDNIMVDTFADTIAVREIPPGGDATANPLFDGGVTCWDQPSYRRAFAWAPTTQAQWDALVAEYVGPASAWFTENGPRGTYLTFMNSSGYTDADGYSQTYLFTGDAIIMAFTKADTDLIVGPPAT